MFGNSDSLVRDNVWDGYYFTYDEKPNGLGGYHSVNLTLRNDATGLRKKITDRYGNFIDFPGVVEGPWRNDLTGFFCERIDFVFRFNRPSAPDRLLDFEWMVQPDGWYYADSDGFGAEKDKEIILTAGMDRNGRFVTPFCAAE